MHDGTIPIAAMTIERFRSKTGHVYVTTDTYFKNTTTQHDRTKYTFNGNSYGKGRLVLAVLQHHIATNPNVSFSKLSRDFPRELQGSSGVFATLENANNIFSETGRKRHFIKTHEVLRLQNGQEIAASNQWGKGNIDWFLENARKLGYKVE